MREGGGGGDAAGAPCQWLRCGSAGLTPVDIASLAGRVDVVARLCALAGVEAEEAQVLRRRAEAVSARRPVGAHGLLHVAVRLNDARAARLIADITDDVVGCRGAESDAALSVAASLGHVSVLRVLLERGAPPNTRSGIGMTALALAAQGGHLEALSTLLAAGAGVHAPCNATCRDAVVAAARHSAPALDALLRAGGDMHDQLVVEAAGHNNADAVRLLLARGMTLTSHQRTSGPTSDIWDALRRQAVSPATVHITVRKGGGLGLC
jgi:hypothetical protein